MAMAVMRRPRWEAATSSRVSPWRPLGRRPAGLGETALAVISGQSQYILNHQPDFLAADPSGAARKALQTIVGQTKRIHSLLRDLMQYARPRPMPGRVVEARGPRM